MTQYYIKIQLKLCRWREYQPHVSHCFKAWSFKNEWDTSLVLYKNCTQVRDERCIEILWAIEPAGLSFILETCTVKGKHWLLENVLWSPHVPWCMHRHLHMHTQTHINSWMLKQISKDQNLGAREKVAPWWKHLLGKHGDQSSHHQNSSPIISALRRWTGTAANITETMRRCLDLLRGCLTDGIGWILNRMNITLVEAIA